MASGAAPTLRIVAFQPQDSCPAFFSPPVRHVVKYHVLRVSPPPLSTVTCPPASSSSSSSPHEVASPCLVSARSQSMGASGRVATFPTSLALIGKALLSAWLHSLLSGLWSYTETRLLSGGLQRLLVTSSMMATIYTSCSSIVN